MIDQKGGYAPGERETRQDEWSEVDVLAALRAYEHKRHHCTEYECAEVKRHQTHTAPRHSVRMLRIHSNQVPWLRRCVRSNAVPASCSSAWQIAPRRSGKPMDGMSRSIMA